MRPEAENRGLVFQMGYMLRYNPAFQLLAEAVSGGWLGKITEIDAMMGKKLDDSGRRDLCGWKAAACSSWAATSWMPSAV